ncbi:hypothetical protein ILUMI_06377 [Ignelater luminosus]|uniref:O-acyltransferase WSD1 C-terminal domain-containing protein n=1 Tax=Ignelater luminosus TaxID=2038154 RepID=A0A8K0D5E4_IGNLU|nr:hypothetical protein ILUMI_06377 [Ignelater luminosus]
MDELLDIMIDIMSIIFFGLLIFLNVRRLKKTTNLEQIPLWFIPSIIGIFLCIPSIITILSILAIFRLFIYVILKTKHRSKFNGLLNGPDAVHMISKEPRHLMNCLIMFQCTKEMSPQVFYDNIKRIVRKMQYYGKLNSKFFTYCGYPYMLGEELNVDDCIREMKTISNLKYKISRSELLSLINECCNLDLPNNNTIPWEIMIGIQKVDWRNDGYHYYPLLLRCDHVIGDGITIIEIIAKMFSNKSSKVKYKLEESEHLVWMENFVKITLKGLHMLMILPAFLISNYIIRVKDNNILYSPTLSHQVFYWSNVDDSSKYVEKIKTIKNTIAGISFQDVVAAAFSASLNDYFIKKSIKLEYISTGVPVLPGSFKLQHIIPEQLRIEDADITNKYSTLVMNIPVHVGFESGSIGDFRKRLHLIKKQSDILLKDSLEYEMTTLFVNTMCTYLPQEIYEWILMKSRYSTAIFTVLPGPPRLHCWQNSAAISDLTGFGPLMYGIGTNVTINSYDGQLNIGISVDKSIIPDEEDVKEIADNILKYTQQPSEPLPNYTQTDQEKWTTI